jgi:hypothetical protein
MGLVLSRMIVRGHTLPGRAVLAAHSFTASTIISATLRCHYSASSTIHIVSRDSRGTEFEAANSSHKGRKGEPAEETTMFYFRINRLTIFDNREGPAAWDLLNLFKTDRAEVKLLSFVTTTDDDLPDVGELIEANVDNARKKALVAEAVKAVVSSRILTTIENVVDGHVMIFGDTGYVLHQSEVIPDQFDWSFLAIESDHGIRSAGEMINAVLSDDGFGVFTDQLLKLIGKAANPAYAAAVGVAKFAVSVLGKVLCANKDDLIGVLYMSLNRREHYLHGERKRDGVADLTNNMLIDYSLFGFES